MAGLLGLILRSSNSKEIQATAAWSSSSMRSSNNDFIFSSSNSKEIQATAGWDPATAAWSWHWARATAWAGSSRKERMPISDTGWGGTAEREAKKRTTDTMERNPLQLEQQSDRAGVLESTINPNVAADVQNSASSPAPAWLAFPTSSIQPQSKSWMILQLQKLEIYIQQTSTCELV